MEQFSNCLRQVLDEVGRQVAHETSLASLEQSIRQLFDSNHPFGKDDAVEMLDASTKCYDLSFRMVDMHLKSANKFFLEYILRLRLIAIQLIGAIVSKLEGEEKSCLFNRDLLEKIVMTSRMALNKGLAYATRSKHINMLAEQVLKKLIDACQKVPPRVLFLHYLNLIECTKYECQLPNFDIVLLRSRIDSMKQVNFGDYNPRDLKYKTEYEPLYESAMLEICINLLKKGLDVSQLIEYLPEKYRLPLLSLYHPGNIDPAQGLSNIPGVSRAYYQLYLEVRDHGLESIDLNFLRDIVTRNWEQRGFFEVVYVRIKQCVKILTLWFELYNEKGQSQFVIDGYKVFVAAANEFLSTGENPTLMLELTIQVAKSLSSHKKTQNQYLVTPQKKCMMVLIKFISQNNNDQHRLIILFDEICLVAKRIRSLQHQKDMTKLMCFYLITRKSARAEKYFKEYQAMVKSKSEIDMIVTLHRCMNTDGQDRLMSVMELIKMKSAAAPIYLMAQPEVLMDLPGDYLMTFKQPLSYYCLILARPLPIIDFGKVIRHLHSSLEKLDIDMKSNAHFLQQIQGLIVSYMKENKISDEDIEYRALVVCLYCQVVIVLGDKLQTKNLSPNQFYRLNLWLSILQPNSNCIGQQSEFVNIGCLILLKCLQKCLSDRERSGRVSMVVGEFDYLQKLYDIVLKCNPNLQILKAIKFTMIQLLVLTEIVPINDIKKMINSQGNKQQLQLYNTIEFLPDEIRLMILRKIVLISMQGNERTELNSEDLKKLILMTNEKQQRIIYIRQLLQTDDPDCRSFVEILADMYPEVAETLVNVEPATQIE